jgi:hypothetical protein
VAAAVAQRGEAARGVAGRWRERRRYVRDDAAIGEVGSVFLPEIDIAGDESDVEPVTRPTESGGRQRRVGVVLRAEACLAPGDAKRGERRGVGVVIALAQSARQESALAVGGVARVAVEGREIIGVVADVCDRSVPAQLVGQADPDRAANPRAVAIVVALAGGRVDRIAVIVVVKAGQLERDARAERNVERAAELTALVAAVAALEITGEPVAGLGEADVDATAAAAPPAGSPRGGRRCR